MDGFEDCQRFEELLSGSRDEGLRVLPASTQRGRCLNCNSKFETKAEIYLCCHLDLHNIRCEAALAPMVLKDAWFSLCKACFSSPGVVKIIARELRLNELGMSPDVGECEGDLHDVLFGLEAGDRGE